MPYSVDSGGNEYSDQTWVRWTANKTRTSTGSVTRPVDKSAPGSKTKETGMRTAALCFTMHGLMIDIQTYQQISGKNFSHFIFD